MRLDPGIVNILTHEKQQYINNSLKSLKTNTRYALVQRTRQPEKKTAIGREAKKKKKQPRKITDTALLCEVAKSYNTREKQTRKPTATVAVTEKREVTEYSSRTADTFPTAHAHSDHFLPKSLLLVYRRVPAPRGS